MHEKLNYKHQIISEPNLHDIILLLFAPHLSYSIYCLVKLNDTVKNKTKLEAAEPFQNV